MCTKASKIGSIFILLPPTSHGTVLLIYHRNMLFVLEIFILYQDMEYMGVMELWKSVCNLSLELHKFSNMTFYHMMMRLSHREVNGRSLYIRGFHIACFTPRSVTQKILRTTWEIIQKCLHKYFYTNAFHKEEPSHISLSRLAQDVCNSSNGYFATRFYHRDNN